MKKKFMGILVCLMIVTTFTTAANKPGKTQVNQQSIERGALSIDDDVPVWEVGDMWTYKIGNIDIDFGANNQTIRLNLQIDELHLEVIRVLDDSYLLAFQASINGNLAINSNLSNGPINITITLSSAPISGNIAIRKSDLGIKNISLYFDGRFIVKIIEQPFFHLPFKLPAIPIRVKVVFNSTFEPPFAILRFPLNTSMIWNLPATNISVDGTIQSIWLNILNFINKVAEALGVKLLPLEIATLLPIVDIGDAFAALNIPSVFRVPQIPSVFACNNTETVTVKAGTYTAYNISVAGGVGTCYYAPQAGNVIKMSGDFKRILPYLRNIDMELVETNYH